MGLNDGLPAGATSLDGEELEGLVPSHLVNRSQLNEWEQQNIEAALLWLSRQRRPQPLEESWLRRLHREMFGQSWRWAGQYRSSDKSIGADWRQIRMQVPALLATSRFRLNTRWIRWIESPSVSITGWFPSTPSPTATVATPA